MVHRFPIVRLCRSATLLAFIVVLTRPDVSVAQGGGAGPTYEIAGFRNVRFGMTEWEVRLSAKRTFRVDDGEMTLSPNAIDGTTKLIVHVRTLEAGLGEGRIEYVFGYRAHKLFQVNVVWGLDTNPQLSNREMLAAALRLQLYFLGYTWANRSARSGIPMDGSTVMLFSGADRNNRAVILTIEGVRYEFDRNGAIRLQPERLAPTRLTVSYAAASSESDVRTVSREEF